MTAPRNKIDALLASKGQPSRWANEQEAAAILGLSETKYREQLESLEASGFPQQFPLNGLRFIPWIDAWIATQLDAWRAKAEESPLADEKELETFGAGQGQRRAS
jgi:hypothetical protein